MAMDFQHALTPLLAFFLLANNVCDMLSSLHLLGFNPPSLAPVLYVRLSDLTPQHAVYVLLCVPSGVALSLCFSKYVVQPLDRKLACYDLGGSCDREGC